MSVSATELLELLAAWWFLTAVYVVGTGVLGVRAGLTFKHGYIGMGPTLGGFGSLGGRVILRLIPLGGSTVFQGDEVDDQEGWQGHRLIDLSPLRRVSVLLAGPLSNLFIGSMVMALSHTRTGTLVGVLGLWLGLVNLLPLPILNGGALVFALFRRTRHQRLDALWAFLVKTDLLLAWFDR